MYAGFELCQLVDTCDVAVGCFARLKTLLIKGGWHIQTTCIIQNAVRCVISNRGHRAYWHGRLGLRLAIISSKYLSGNHSKPLDAAPISHGMMSNGNTGQASNHAGYNYRIPTKQGCNIINADVRNPLTLLGSGAGLKSLI